MSKSQIYQWTQCDEIRNRLRGLLTYRSLFDAIWPGAFEHPVVVQSLRAAAQWIETASDPEILERGADLHNQLMELVDKAKELLPPKCSDSQILADFAYCRDHSEFSWERGIQYSWITKWFDARRLPVPTDFPLHGRIGVGRHSGTFVVEESQLLRDAYYLRGKVSQLWAAIEECVRREKRHAGPLVLREVGSSINARLCCVARLAVFSFYSFVECFVNSVANDYLLRNPKVAAETQELLRGSKKGRFFGIEYKLEKYPGLIRGDEKSIYVLSDSKQLREPFTSFVGLLKELRGSTAHFAVDKSPIWLKPQEWVLHVEAASASCIEVAKRFWLACYPSQPYPSYLFSFDTIKLEKDALTNLAAEVDARDITDRCELVASVSPVITPTNATTGLPRST